MLHHPKLIIHAAFDGRHDEVLFTRDFNALETGSRKKPANRSARLERFIRAGLEDPRPLFAKQVQRDPAG